MPVKKREFHDKVAEFCRIVGLDPNNLNEEGIFEWPEKNTGNISEKPSFKDEGPGFYRQIADVSGKSVGVNAQIEFGTYAAAGKVGKGT